LNQQSATPSPKFPNDSPFAIGQNDYSVREDGQHIGRIRFRGPMADPLAQPKRTSSLLRGGMEEAGFSAVAAQSQLALSGRRDSTDTTLEWLIS
jgi:hypothetical protein